MAVLYFGTCGWSYKEWIGPFYEKKEKMLTYYSRLFRSVEIDSTFYRYPTKEQIYGYDRTVSGDFIFTAKLPKVLTHEKLLDKKLGIEQDLTRFLELMEPLQSSGKLGAILVQLPPSFTYESNLFNFKDFIEILPKGYDFAVEFRDPSWLRDDIWKLLKDHNVAYTIVDEPLVPPEVHITADFSYIRWHGRGKKPWYNFVYTNEELERWIPNIKDVSERVHTLYGYFNNHYHGYAPENCIDVLGMLEMATPEQLRIKEKIVKYNAGNHPAESVETLEDFSINSSKLTVETLLLQLTDYVRVERARTMKNEELSFKEEKDDTIIANIRGYSISINTSANVILHDCEDWKKGLNDKRLCKHVIKFFLMLPKERSIQILTNIINNKNQWEFK
ncbi:MAG: DUF72 domain-containing protein [Nitrososphaeria archaeon]